MTRSSETSFDYVDRQIALAAILIVAVNALDLASTLAASPDLSGEWNVLARVFGLGWAGLIGAKLIGGVLAIAGYSYYARNREACYPAPGGSSADFARGFLFGEGPLAGAQSRADSVRRTLVCAGYLWTGMQAVVLWVALDNLGILFGVRSPLRIGSETAYHYMQTALVGIAVLTRYYAVNLARYRSMPARAAVRSAEARSTTPVSH